MALSADPSGFDYQTAADLVMGRKVPVDAARNFATSAKFAHERKAYLAQENQDLKRKVINLESEIALLKSELMRLEAQDEKETHESES